MTMRHPLTVLPLHFILLVAGAGCRTSAPPEEFHSDMSAKVAAVPAAAVTEEALGQFSGLEARKLVRRAHLDLRVANSEQAVAEIRRLTEFWQGFVDQLDTQLVEGQYHYTMVVRIPADQLEGALAEIRRIAQSVERESIRTEDVTERHIDLEARLRTLKATEKELQALLAESRSRRHSVEDIMSVYQRLIEIRSQIEQFQGQVDALNRLISYSTVHLQVAPSRTAPPLVRSDWKPWETAVTSARQLIDLLRAAADLAIVLVVLVLPVVVLIGAPLWLLSRFWRQRRAGGMQAQ